MSTFDGYVSEFPQIRIDWFRPHPNRPPPLACFLSHVHSDHLAGLETLKAPFVYCSPTTRELLLRLEKFPHRMNFTKNILECRKQTYKHLQRVLKPIPLETPTTIELSPGNSICVTLFDANHCSGAVMFLIEGQGKAVLYTGDIRSEEWWVNNLVRHPKIIPYSSGQRHLDTIYLDTTFATKIDRYLHFPSKYDGLRELLEKIQGYPEDTIFHFNAWTFGYEEVWLALSQALDSPVHLDRYRYSLYTSVSKNNGAALECREAPVFCGFQMGNTPQPGILTTDKEARLHSCERGTGCPVFDLDNASKLVTITPIISRFAGREMRELGAGGGHGDLDQKHELDLTDLVAVQQLFALCVAQIKDETVLKQIVEMLKTHLQKKMKGLTLEADNDDVENSKLDLNAIPLEELPVMLAEMAKHEPKIKKEEEDVEVVPPPVPTIPTTSAKAQPKAQLPRSITFPYSRHSSHHELRFLVAAFRSRDVWPNTFVQPKHWEESMSMETMFGDLCDRLPGQTMAFDVEMRADVAKLEKQKRELQAAQRHRAQTETQHSEEEDEVMEEPASTSPGYQTERDAPPSSPLPMCVEPPRPLIPSASLPEMEALQPGQVALKQGNPKQETPTGRIPRKEATPKQALPKQATPKEAPPKQVTPNQAPPTQAPSQQASAAPPTNPGTRSKPAPPIETTAASPPSTANHHLTTLDDRIEAAFAEDGIISSANIQHSTSPHLQPPSTNHHTANSTRTRTRHPATLAPAPAPAPAQIPASSLIPTPTSLTPQPHSTASTTTTTRASTTHLTEPTLPSSNASPSSLERHRARKRAFEAAMGGSWADEIELVSVSGSGGGGGRRARGRGK